MFRRLIAWSFFLGVLAVVGGGVFHGVRYRPRLVLDGRRVEHLSSDGRWLVVLHRDHWGGEIEGPLEVWDTHTGRLARSIDVITPVRLSPDGRHVYCDADDNRVRFIDWRTGETWTPPGEAHTVACDFSPRGRWFTTADAVIDVANRQVCWRPEGTLIGFTGDDRYAICHDQKGLVTVHDPANGDWTGTLDLKLARWQRPDLTGAFGGVPAAFVVDFGSVHFSADGRWLIHFVEMDHQTMFRMGSGMPGRQRNRDIVSMPCKGVELWDVRTRKRALRVTSSSYQCPAILVSPDGERVAAWDESRQSTGEVTLYDATGTKLFSVRRDGVWEAWFTTDGSRLLLVRNSAVMGEADEVTMLDVATGKVLWEADSCDMVFFGADGDVLQATSKGTLQFLDGRTGQVRRTLATGLTLAHFHTNTTDGHRAALGGRYLRDDSLEALLAQWLPAVFGQNKDVVLVADMRTGNVLLRPRHADIEVTVPTLSGDGGTLVTMHDDDILTIRVWDVDSHSAWLWTFVMTGTLALIAMTLSTRRARRRLKRAEATEKARIAASEPHPNP